MEVAYLEGSCRNAAELEIQGFGWAQEVAVWPAAHILMSFPPPHKENRRDSPGWAESRECLEGREQDLGVGFWAKGSCNSCTRGYHHMRCLSAVHTSFRKISLWNKITFPALFRHEHESTSRLGRGWAGAVWGPSCLGEGSLCDYCFLLSFQTAFCSLLHCPSSIAESDVNRFVVEKRFMAQFNFSSVLPLFPALFFFRRGKDLHDALCQGGRGLLTMLTVLSCSSREWTWVII